MDIVIRDLAAQYAIKTEDVPSDALVAGGTAATANLADRRRHRRPASRPRSGAPPARCTPPSKGRAGCSLAAPPHMLGQIGPAVRARQPDRTPSRRGSRPRTSGTGAVGSIAGIPLYVSAGIADNETLFVMSTAAAEVYEDRIGSLQVVEPSVLGVQVAYAGVVRAADLAGDRDHQVVKTP